MTGRRLADQVGILSVGSAGALVVQTLLGIFLARYWSRDAFGSYLQVTLLVATISPILFLGIPSSLYYFLPRYEDERRHRILVQSLAMLVLLGAAGAAAIALAAGPLAAALNNDDLAPAVRRYGLALAGMLPASAAHPLLVSRGRYRAATLVVLGVALADAVVTVASVLAGATLETLALALGVTHLGIGAGAFGLGMRMVGGVGRALAVAWPPSPALLREQLRYAVPLATSTHLATFGRLLDRYIIGALFVPALFAVYSVGAKQVPIAPLILTSLNIVLQQRFTGLYRDGRAAEILPLWQRAVRKQALLVLPLAALLFVMADPFVTGLYSDRYRDSVPVFRVYLGLLVLRVATWPIVLTSVGETRTLLVGSIASLLTGAAVSIALVRPLGLLGPAVGAVAGPLVVALYYQRRTATLLGVPWLSLVPWRPVLAVAATAAAAALPLTPFAHVGSPLLALFAAAAYALLFVGLAGATGLLTRDDVSVLWRWLGLTPGAYRLPRRLPRVQSR